MCLFHKFLLIDIMFIFLKLSNIEMIISDNDKAAWEFIQETYGPKVKDWNSIVDILYRSIDDID